MTEGNYTFTQVQAYQLISVILGSAIFPRTYVFTDEISGTPKGVRGIAIDSEGEIGSSRTIETIA